MAVICSFPLISLRTFWFMPLLLFQCSISCECRWVLSKMKDNRLPMHPSSHWHDTLPLPADLCGYLSACWFSLPVIYTGQLSIHTTKFTAKLICIQVLKADFQRHLQHWLLQSSVTPREPCWMWDVLLWWDRGWWALVFALGGCDHIFYTYAILTMDVWPKQNEKGDSKCP